MANITGITYIITVGISLVRIRRCLAVVNDIAHIIAIIIRVADVARAVTVNVTLKRVRTSRTVIEGIGDTILVTIGSGPVRSGPGAWCRACVSLTATYHPFHITYIPTPTTKRPMPSQRTGNPVVPSPANQDIVPLVITDNVVL
jgi:hypothetical protein